LAVPRLRPREDESPDRGDRCHLGAPEGGRVVAHAGRTTDSFAVDVDQRPAGVEKDGANVLQTASSARTAASSSSAMERTSPASGPSTRIRKRGSVPEYRRKTRPLALRASSA